MLQAHIPYTISGTVKELSAIFVDKMIFLVPGGGEKNTFRCSSVVSDECNGKICHFFFGALLEINSLKYLHRLNRVPSASILESLNYFIHEILEQFI